MAAAAAVPLNLAHAPGLSNDCIARRRGYRLGAMETHAEKLERVLREDVAVVPYTRAKTEFVVRATALARTHFARATAVSQPNNE